MYVLSPMFVFFPKPAFGGGLCAVARRKCSRSYLHLTRWGETGTEQGGLCTTNLVSRILEPSVRLVGRGGPKPSGNLWLMIIIFRAGQ